MVRVHTHDLHRPWVITNPYPNIKLIRPQWDAGSLFILLKRFHVYILFLKPLQIPDINMQPWLEIPVGVSQAFGKPRRAP